MWVPEKGYSPEKLQKQSPDSDGCAKVPQSINNPYLCVPHLWIQPTADKKYLKKKKLPKSTT